MMIDENKLFRHATLLICGHLEIEEAIPGIRKHH